jgi:hypothetical protein
VRRLALLLLAGGCATQPKPPVVPPPVAPVMAQANADELAQREIARRFVAALDARDFAAAHSLLFKPLRERYSVERLAADFAAEPLAAPRLEKVRAHLDAPLHDGALEWGPGRFLRLAREGEGWRIASLE